MIPTFEKTPDDTICKWKNIIQTDIWGKNSIEKRKDKKHLYCLKKINQYHCLVKRKNRQNSLS